MDNPTTEDEGEATGPGSETVTIELLEDELIAEKQTVQTGLIRIRRQLITETRTFEVTIRHEELEVQHLPPSQREEGFGDQEPQIPTAGVRTLQPGETVSLTLLSEEVVVDKQPVVTSEAIVSKRIVEEVQSLAAVVRREVAEVTHRGNLDAVRDQQDRQARLDYGTRKG